MAKRKKPKNSGFYKLHMEHLYEITELNNEQEVYDFIFSGQSQCVRPAWMTVAPQPIEEYWLYNQPYVKFCSRFMAITLPSQEDSNI